MREWLKKAREDAGLTMKQVAEQLHISESYYCSIENGVRQKSMGISIAEQLSRTLNVPIKKVLIAEAELRNATESSN